MPTNLQSYQLHPVLSIMVSLVGAMKTPTATFRLYDDPDGLWLSITIGDDESRVLLDWQTLSQVILTMAQKWKAHHNSSQAVLTR